MRNARPPESDGRKKKARKSVYQVRKALWSYPTGDGLVYRQLGTARLIKELGVARGGPPSGRIQSFTTHIHTYTGTASKQAKRASGKKSGKRKSGVRR